MDNGENMYKYRTIVSSSVCRALLGIAIVNHIVKYRTMYTQHCTKLTLTVPQWEGMGGVGSARYELALLPPCPTIRVLSYSNW